MLFSDLCWNGCSVSHDARVTCAFCPVTADDIELNLRPWTNNQEMKVDIR